jgi:hypothetical protein
MVMNNLFSGERDINTVILSRSKNLRFKLICASCLLVGAFLLYAKTSPAGEPEDWPLDLATHYLTSNFMEYRSGRFHAGIDLKTETITGFAVKAVEDGYVVRVRATPFAYGRAIYVRGVSGKTYVYAHLARFNDVIRHRVDGARRKSGKYRVRLEFKAGEIAVKKGDVLGLSGESGTGGPHLHFEVRDEKQRPLNPHAHGFPVPDTMAPAFHTLRVIPMSDDAVINGQNSSMVIKIEGPVDDAAGGTFLVAPLQIEGPVAFSAKIVDHADIRKHKLEPWLIAVAVGNETVYECRNDRYAFGDNSLQRLEWLNLPARDGHPPIREHWLYNRNENTLDGRVGTSSSWGSDGDILTPGIHQVHFTAGDFAGNETIIILPLLVGNPQNKDLFLTIDPDLKLRNGPYSQWQPEPVQVMIQADSKGNSSHWLTPFGKGKEQGAGPFPALLYLDPANGDPVLAPTMLTDIPLDFTPEQEAAMATQGLVPTGRPTAYWSADWVIDAAVPVPVPMPPSPDGGLMAYQWKNDQWEPEESVIAGKSEGSGQFLLSSPGVYGFFHDELPPFIGFRNKTIQVEATSVGTVHGITMPRWQTIAIPMVDAGSGIAPETIKTFWDGSPIIVEPDLPRDRVLVVIPDETKVGMHRLIIGVADEAGNLTRLEISVGVGP